MNNPGQHLQNQVIAGGPDIYCLPIGKGDLFLYIEAIFTLPKRIHEDLGLIFPDSAEVSNIRRRRMILPAVTKPLILQTVGLSKGRPMLFYHPMMEEINKRTSVKPVKKIK